MSRILFLILIAVVVYWLLSSYRKKEQESEAQAGEAEDMVRCAHCGLHLPKQESIGGNGRYYCSEEHRREHADK